MKEETMPAPVAKWVKQSLYIRMTGHTLETLKLFRRNNLKEGQHWKRSPEGPQTFYYDHARIDRLMDLIK